MIVMMFRFQEEERFMKWCTQEEKELTSHLKKMEDAA
jgi:hypothetical protein